ncbi:MAG: phosphotransferase [Victivallales bacterium]|nr:phosphotransferase [Victivallales bacterium]
MATIRCMSDLPGQPNDAESPESAIWPRVSELLAKSQLLRAATSGGTANVYVYEKNGRKYLVKSFAKHNFFMRWIFGRSTIGNEWRVLKALKEAEIPCVPQGFALLEDNTLIMEFIGGMQLGGKLSDPIKNNIKISFFKELMMLMKKCHLAGFAHGDFRRANILVSEDGRPWVIDWATATYCPPGTSKWHFLRRAINRQQQLSDLYSLVKIIDDYYPELITEEERRASRPNWLLRLGRYLRRTFYRHGIKKWFGRTKHAKLSKQGGAPNA